MFFSIKKAQAAAEYAALLAILGAAILGIKIYFQRAIQGKVKALADQISPYQYNPGNTKSTTITTITGNGTLEMKAFETNYTGEENTIRTWEEITENEDVVVQ
ncbi:MAG: hypothetical protein NC936_03205 [Candidatus Omnitrophica bacterium]|nr:hypothetical protein [Candidatus Omnitrophota bacterium]